MTWAKVDDHANEHRKQLAAGAEACWLWTCGLMYANRQAARDGFIPDGMLQMLYPFRAPTKLALRLVEVGLWERVSGGYLIHQFTHWNQTKEQREAELEKGRERAAKSYESRRAKNRKSSPEETPQTTREESPSLHDSSGSTPTPTPLRSEDQHQGPESLERSTPGPVVVDFDREIMCPADLLERAEQAGVFPSLAEKLAVSEESLRKEAQSYVGYWTIGKGAGQRRGNWMGRLRQRLIDQSEKGNLPKVELEVHTWPG